MKSNKDVFITIDVDWAPDYMVTYLAKKLVRKQIKATWFITHKSTAIKDMIS